MVDATNEFAIDPRTGEAIAVDPPLPENDAPLMGNPVLARSSVPRKGRSNIGLYGGIAAAVVILGGGAILFAAQARHANELTTSSDATQPVQEQAAATPAPMATPTAPIVADASTREAPVLPARVSRSEISGVRHAEHRAAARTAEDNGADTAATVTQSQVAPPPVTASTPAPAPAPDLSATPAPSAPDAAPVITPPPAGQ
jgi:hypothetical protein